MSASKAEAIGHPINFKDLANEISEIEGVISCTIINYHGATKGRTNGEVQYDAELKDRAGEIAAVVWGGLKRVEPIGGPLKSVTAEFENFQIIGTPIPKTRIAILVTVPLTVDRAYMKERVTSYTQYWLQVH
jgi:hypothetical protein